MYWDDCKFVNMTLVLRHCSLIWASFKACISKSRDIVVGLYWFLLDVARKINCQTYDELWENIDWLLPTTSNHLQKKLEN